MEDRKRIVQELRALAGNRRIGLRNIADWTMVKDTIFPTPGETVVFLPASKIYVKIKETLVRGIQQE